MSIYTPVHVVRNRFPFVYQLEPDFSASETIKPIYRDNRYIGSYVIKPFVGFDSRYVSQSRLCLGLEFYEPRTCQWRGGGAVKIRSVGDILKKPNPEITLRQQVIVLYRAMWVMVYLNQIRFYTADHDSIDRKQDSLVYARNVALYRYNYTWDKVTTDKDFVFLQNSNTYQSIQDIEVVLSDCEIALIQQRFVYEPGYSIADWRRLPL